MLLLITPGKNIYNYIPALAVAEYDQQIRKVKGFMNADRSSLETSHQSGKLYLYDPELSAFIDHSFSTFNCFLRYSGLFWCAGKWVPKSRADTIKYMVALDSLAHDTLPS